MMAGKKATQSRIKLYRQNGGYRGRFPLLRGSFPRLLAWKKVPAIDIRSMRDVRGKQKRTCVHSPCQFLSTHFPFSFHHFSFLELHEI